MKKSYIHVVAFCCYALSFPALYTNNIQFVTGAPVGGTSEPDYSSGATSIDWLSEPIEGNYYVAVSTADIGFGVEIVKSVAIYRFIPGNPPTTGMLEFIASAPTGQCIFDPVTQQDVCDDSFRETVWLNWFPHAIDGEYFFSVVGVEAESLLSRLGVQGQQTIRVYRFNPSNGTNEFIDFIDSAPLQISEDEPQFSDVNSVDWFPGDIDGMYYFAVCGRGFRMPQVRIYLFNATAPLGTNLSFVGEAANGITDLSFAGEANSIDWLPQKVNGQNYFAVGGTDEITPIRVYQFCPNSCQGTDTSPDNTIRLIATAPTGSVLDSPINQANSVSWLVTDNRYYLAVAVRESVFSPLRKTRSVRLYEFIPGITDPIQGVLQLVTSAPVGIACCESGLIDEIGRVARVDWLTKNGNHYLLVGAEKLGNIIAVLVYQFDITTRKLLFLAEQVINVSSASPSISSVNWFSGEIERSCYFGVSILGGPSFLHRANEPLFAQIFKFRPPCDFSGLSCH